ncbi:NPCBM/NEW2 domain-containing protein [Anaeromassilibacillus sp. 1001302B_160321_C8]|uniref:NPCBM/NEW2 domain-containing protein n=1 Tax=Anaeromassilibacillus sp. 1001302B_160321_C8 TaxID=2787132 RepID=UPI00189B774C|nr:NPCBM/NEW2 domain-containing protein [Anaeromassilibacillus sp. 1001302B_160321_C8]
MKKRLLALLLALSLAAPGFGTTPAAFAAQRGAGLPPDAKSTTAPDKDLQINFWMDEGVPYYNVVLNGTALLEDGTLGLNTTAGSFQNNLTLVSEETDSGDETWTPLVGDKSVIEDRFNETAVTLSNAEGKTVTIEMRAYNTGVAFRYVLPEMETDYQITDEYTQFAFPEGAVAQIHEGTNQTVPQTIPVESFEGRHYCRPMTVEYADGEVVSICEANLDDYAVMYMTKCADRTLQAKYDGDVVNVSANTQKSSPWRTFVVAEELARLPENEDIILNLNEPADEDMYKFSEWVKPGRNLMLGAGSETTETLKDWIDTAKAENFEYVLLDYGWYGPELDDRCDPRLDPSKLEPEPGDSEELLEVKRIMKEFIPEDGVFDAGEGFPPYGLITGEPVPGWPEGGLFKPHLDIPAICEYANSQGVGMILYVNNRHMFDKYGRYTVDELFARFEEWGAAGVKPGFMQEGDQEYEKRNQEMVEAAARHHLVLTIHDEYVPTGLERTYPNLLTTEGILGDEGIQGDQIAQDISTLFTRAIQGPADHTFCYPGKATKGYALASSLLFRTGMHSLYWYGNPTNIPQIPEQERQFWKDLPSNWDELRVLEASMSEYATYARKARGEDVWFAGSISAIDRELQMPLDFLTPGQQYVAEVYEDEIGLSGTSSDKNSSPLICISYLVDSTDTMYYPMAYGTGYAVRFRPATAEDAGLPVYNMNAERLQNHLAGLDSLKESDYTVATWQRLEEAIAAANALLESGNAITDEQAQEAIAALDAAKEGLRSVNVLLEQVNKAKCLPEAHYTPESWAPLAEAMEEANALLASVEDVSQSQLDEAAVKLENALNGLVKKALELDTTVYLSDLDFEPESYSAYTAIQKDRSHENPKLELIVNGERTTFEKGLGAHATSEIYYNIEGKGYEIFEAYVGVDALKDNMGDIIFRVYSDDVLIYESQPSGNGATEAQKISIPVANTKILRLEADTNGPDTGDHADWADAKFLTMKEIDPSSTITGISIDGEPVQEFDPGQYDYYYPIEEGDAVPEVTVEKSNDAVTYEISPAKKVPGVTEITVHRPDGGTFVYRISFCTTKAVYLSDLEWDSLDNQGTYGHAVKDSGVEGLDMVVTGPDGEALDLPLVDGKRKGIGMHSYCSVTYDIAGKGYSRFESWVGANHLKEYNNSMIFKVYFDNETEPRYTSPAMSYLVPAEFVSLDLTGVRTIRLELDSNGSINGDHGNWADAKFLKYDEIPEETGVALGLEAPETVEAGSEFEVKGTIGGLDALESPVASLQMVMKYPEGLTCTEVVPNEVLGDTFEYSIHDGELQVNFLYLANDIGEGLPADLDSLFTAKFTASPDMAEGDYTLALEDVFLADWNIEAVPYTAEGASVHVTELPKEPQLLTVQWSGNASMSVEGETEEIISTDAIYGAKVQPGEELTFTFTPTDGAFSGAQLNGEDIKFAADGCTYTFTMPGESTTLRFTFTSVDKSILGIVLEEANAVPQDVIDSLVPSAKEFFENALAKAQEVYEDAAATEEEVKEAWSDLLDAMHLLEFEAGDKETLLPLINIAEQLAERLDEFKPGTTEGFEEALNAAKDVYAEENPLKADVDEAYDNLQAAIEKLEFRADMSELQSLVDEANTLDPDDYIQDEAFDTFTTVLAEAEELLLNADAGQADVDAKAEALTRAMAALRKIPNKDELNKLIAEMEQKDLDGYTDRSVAAFKAALSVAKTVAADETADGQAVAKAYTNLEAAANNLVKAEKPSTGNSGKGSTSANIGNAYGAAGVVSAAQGVTSQKAYVVSDTTVNFNLKRGSAYCFKMTVVNGNAMTPSFTVGNGEVLKTQFVAKVGNDYYYRVYAIGTPGQSTGVYTTLPGQNAVKHCTVTIA